MSSASEFPNPLFSIPKLTSGSCEFEFGQHKVKVNKIFLETEHSRAFVNRKCVLPGHVLVIPKIPTLRLAEGRGLSATQITDLFLLVQKVEQIMEGIHGAKSTTINIQDGPDAGQTVHHLHVHIIPRKHGDLLDNDVYKKLATHDQETNIQWRNEEDMVAEANMIRKYIVEKYAAIFWTVPVLDMIS